MEQELKMSIPIRIVKNTFEHLRMKEAMQKEAFRIEDSKSKMNLGTGSEESHISQGSNELINLRRRTISGFPSKESVEDEDVENLNVVQENLIIISTAMKGIKKNVFGNQIVDNKIKHDLKDNLEMLMRIIDEAGGNSHL